MKDLTERQQEIYELLTLKINRNIIDARAIESIFELIDALIEDLQEGVND